MSSLTDIASSPNVIKSCLLRTIMPINVIVLVNNLYKTVYTRICNLDRNFSHFLYFSVTYSMNYL